MTQISKLALWGAWRSFAIFSPKQPLFADPLPRLSRHLARDIGLTDGDHEKAHFQWPSDGPDRPLL